MILIRNALLVSFTISTVACSPVEAGPDYSMAKSVAVEQPDDGISVAHRFAGPGLVCAIGFAIMVEVGEEITRYDRGMDFITYHLENGEDSAVLYEGNHPQPSDRVISTGQEFPELVAIHLNDNGYTMELGDRILVGTDMPALCEEYSYE